MQQSDVLTVAKIEEVFTESTGNELKQFLLSLEDDPIKVEYFSFIFSSRVKNGIEPFVTFADKYKVLKEAIKGYVEDMKDRNSDIPVMENAFLHLYSKNNNTSIDIGWGEDKSQVWKRISLKDIESPALLYACLQGIVPTSYYFFMDAPTNITEKSLNIN